MESSLTGRTSGPFYELFTINLSVLPLPVSGSDPHLNCGLPKSRRVAALDAQCLTRGHSRPARLLNE